MKYLRKMPLHISRNIWGWIYLQYTYKTHNNLLKDICFPQVIYKWLCFAAPDKDDAKNKTWKTKEKELLLNRT